MSNCNICSSNKLIRVFSNNKIPKYNLHYPEKLSTSLKLKTTSVNFYICSRCNFLFNKSYKNLNYRVNYNSNRSYSKKYTQYIRHVYKYLFQNINSKNVKNIVEIGFGDQSFIKLLNNTKKKIYGFDPSFKKKKLFNKNIKLYKKNYTPNKKLQPDLLILRHIIEHIKDPKSFLKNITKNKPRYLFLEFPCSSYVLNENFHYFSNEHCSYFDTKSIKYLLNKLNYKILKIKKVFQNENLIVIAEKNIKNNDKFLNKKTKNKIPININYFLEFKKYKDKILKKINFNNKDIIWGASGKGVMLLNILNINYKKMPFIIDKNIEIHDKYIYKMGNKIISPNKIKSKLNKDSKIIILNKLYKKEIFSEMKKLKIKNKLITLFK